MDQPKISLGTKMAHYKTDGFIIRPPYMDIHLSYVLHSAIGQLRTSSHQLQIEVGRYKRRPLEERLCQLCHQGVESVEQSQLPLAPSPLLMLQVNQGIHKWSPDQDIKKGLQ